MIDLIPSLSWANKIAKCDLTDSVFFNSVNSSDLIIVSGDSWTWGDSLDPSIRTNQMYGTLLGKELDCDLLNIGFRGWSNSWILNFTGYLLQNQQHNFEKYKNITLVVTLTENARDVKAPHSFSYNYLETHKNIGTTLEFYNQILNDIEQNWVKLLDQIHSYGLISKTIIASNFVWHNNFFKSIENKYQIPQLNWVESIANYANYKMPVRTNMVTGWIFDEFATVNDICGIKKLDTYKQFVLPYIEKANKVNKWLDASDYNGKEASKHPNYLGHKIWATYLLNCME